MVCANQLVKVIITPSLAGIMIIITGGDFCVNMQLY